MYFIRDKEWRFFVGDTLMWTNDIESATFYTFPEFAQEHIKKVLPSMPPEDYVVYLLDFSPRRHLPGSSMCFSPFKP